MAQDRTITDAGFWHDLGTRPVPRRPRRADWSQKLAGGATLYVHRRHAGPLGPDPSTRRRPELARIAHATVADRAREVTVRWQNAIEWIRNPGHAERIGEWAQADGSTRGRQCRGLWYLELADGRRKRDPNQYHFSRHPRAGNGQGHGGFYTGRPRTFTLGTYPQTMRRAANIGDELEYVLDEWRTATHLPPRLMLACGPIGLRPDGPEARFTIELTEDGRRPDGHVHLRTRTVWRWGPADPWAAGRLARRCRHLMTMNDHA